MNLKWVTVVESSEDVETGTAMFRDWLDQTVETIPAEFRDTAEIRIEAYDAGYGCDSFPRLSLEVGYYRPATEEEKAEMPASRGAACQQWRAGVVLCAQLYKVCRRLGGFGKPVPWLRW